MLSERVKKIIAGILLFVGLVSVIVSLVDTPVTICSGLNGVSNCTPPNYGSLAVYLTISGVFLLGGMYILATLRNASRRSLPPGTHGIQ
jgi:hypothetical protein